MKMLSFVIAAVLILVAIFAAANWSVLIQSTTLSFVAFETQAPLGIILLGVTLGVVALVVGYALTLRTNWLMETHRLNKEVQKQRELAEQAETSRTSELRSLIELELTAVRTAIQETAALTVARTEASERSLSQALNEAVNSLNAHIGYFDDKLNRALPAGDSDQAPGRED